MNAGQIVGIIFGVVLGALIIVLAVMTVISRRRRKSQFEHHPLQFDNPVYNGQQIELESKTITTVPPATDSTGYGY